MRNLTKVLALVLSLAFVMTMFAGAINLVPKYSDSADLSAAGDEAVSVLSALDIVDGYLDGSYQGSKAVTRAEYAKLIAIASNGYDATPFYDTTSVNFVDAVDAWALPYVNYCYLTGILAGYTDGTVKAANAVKGVEAIKMTLVALGYNPVIEGLVGANWVENTVTLARRAGLLVNLEAKNLYAEFDREATAILVYNALYADVVEYVGNTATATGATLGEDAFDLLDVTATIVANDGKALGNVYSDLMVKDDKATAMYLEYDVAKKDTTTVVYRAYVADTKGGYFTPVVLNLAIDTNNDDLGKVYRILTTNTNAAAGRVVYGVLEANPNGLTTKYAYELKADAKFAGIVAKMAAKAAAAGVAAPKNVMIDNAFATFAEVEAWFAANDDTNSPVVMIDNNTDGTVDTLKVYTRKYAEVIDVDATHYYVQWGNKVERFELAKFDFELAENDWISYDALKGYQKLAAATGMVTAISAGAITVNGVATATGVDSATTNQAKIVAALGGVPGVNATVWYDADGKAYAVDAILTDAASWQNYGIITGWSDDVLGMQTVRIFDANNTYNTYVVTAINGHKEYDQYLNSFWHELGINCLVKYYVDGNTVALYTYASDLMIGEKVAAGAASFTTKYDEWTIDGVAYDWDNGIIFAAVENNYQLFTDEKMDLIWRAYDHDEFQPYAGIFAGSFNGVVNGLDNYVKVGAVIAEEGTMLPGLVLGNDKWLTLTAAPALVYTASEDGVVTYTYELTYAVPNGKPNTTAKTQIVSDLPLAHDINRGDILRATFDDNGNVIYWIDSVMKDFFKNPNVTPDGINEYFYVGNGLELAKLTLDYAREDAKGVVDVFVKDIDEAEMKKWYDSFDQSLVAHDYRWFKLAENCDFYLVDGIGTSSCAVNTDINDYYGTWADVLNRAAKAGYAVYADVNMATREINSIWIDTTNLQPVTTVVTLPAILTYDEATQIATWTYVYDNFYYGAAKTFTYSESRMPWELPCNDNGETTIKITVDREGKIIKEEVKAGPAYELYNKENAQAFVNDSTTLKVFTDIDELNLVEDYKVTTKSQIWWYRAEPTIDRVHKIYDGNVTLDTDWDCDDAAYDNWTAIVNAFDSDLNDHYTPNGGNEYTYEYFYVIANDKGEIEIMVLVDTNDTKVNDVTKFPYND